jgi:hypothetical protein
MRISAPALRTDGTGTVNLKIGVRGGSLKR